MSKHFEGWDAKREWWKRGDNFLIVIKHHSEPPLDEGDPFLFGRDDGRKRWCVYAYIFPGHPRFAQQDGTEGFYQPATTGLTLHGGVSYVRVHVDVKREITSLQVGCDYNHIHDGWYTHMDPEHAAGVFSDAQDLFDQLTREQVEAGLRAAGDEIWASIQTYDGRPTVVGAQFKVEVLP